MTTEERANWQGERISRLTEELKRERILKAELLKALKGLREVISDKEATLEDLGMACSDADAAIAIAEGRKPK